jgi:putative hydrolase of the HAD superfamily
LRDRRVEAWVGILDGTGFGVERQAIDAAMDATWQAYVASWHANEQFQAAQAAEAAIEALGLAVPDDVRGELVDAFADVGATAELHITDNIGDCLRSLRDAGARLGIICDVGFTPSVVLRAHLEQAGLLDLFHHWSFSDEVGVYKPAPAIFEHALTGLGGIVPAEAAHIGDLRRTDIAGALGMGMTAVRYTGVFDDDSQPEPEGHHVVADHADLPGVLGVS